RNSTTMSGPATCRAATNMSTRPVVAAWPSAPRFRDVPSGSASNVRASPPSTRWCASDATRSTTAVIVYRRENWAPFVALSGSNAIASWKPPNRSMRLPADCTAANTSITRKPSAAPASTWSTRSPTNAPAEDSIDDAVPVRADAEAARGAVASARPIASIALTRPGTDRCENGGAMTRKAAMRTPASSTTSRVARATVRFTSTAQERRDAPVQLGRERDELGDHPVTRDEQRDADGDGLRHERE